MPQNTCRTFDPAFLDDVIDGLSTVPKELSCKYFYDQAGSELFDQICELDEYYLTRAETAIINKHVDEMAYQLGKRVMLIEFGSGSSTKTRLILERLQAPAAYVPIDISRSHLLAVAGGLRQSFPHLEVLPIVGDFTKPFQLPKSTAPPSHAAVFFPGSTIGNFKPEEAQKLLQRIAGLLGEDGGLLIGIDLQKEPAMIEAAYNDAKGITAAFNLNLLHRINRELDGDFEVSEFEHLAEYNEEFGRVETYIVSRKQQSVRIGDESFSFEKGERIFTEYSHKYTIAGFENMAGQAGFSLHKYWTDDQNRFAILHLVNEG